MRGELKSWKRPKGKWHDIFPIAIFWAVMLAWLVFIIGYTPVEMGILHIFQYDV